MSANIRHAIRLLRTGQPLPVDLMVALLAEGVDVGALERKFT